MPSSKDGRGVSARPVVEDLWAGWKAQALVAAVDLDIFRHLASGKRSVGEIAAAAHATPRGIRGLLDTLVAMRYLGKRGDRYNLRPLADIFLVPGRPSYIGSAVALTRSLWSDWARLADVVRSGRSLGSAGIETVHAQLAEGLFELNHRTACWAVEALPASRLRSIRRILDLAADTGAWSLAFAKTLREVHVTAIDFPATLRITRRQASRRGLARHYKFLPGDFRKMVFSPEAFDLVILGHSLHALGPSDAGELIRKTATALKPDGLLLAAGFFPNDVRTGPLLPLLFGLNMLLHTPEGDAFTLRQYRNWMREAGLQGARTLSGVAVSPLILARKK
ncbi:MAG: methyltransferase domain-containing protein [Acidobacteriota bacterium]|nr:methyltransferase domain-containing protein [Acidobacteriota bacterium]